MFHGIHWQAFLIASFVLAAIPGPGMLYVLARSLQSGMRDGLLSTLGTALGGLVHVVATAFGLSVILATSASAFMTLKWVGAFYLIFLGLKQLFAARADRAAILPDDLTALPPKPTWPAIRDGFFTEALNPKTALFFLALLPQFVALDDAPLAPRLILLGLIVVTFNSTADIVACVAASPLGRYLRRRPKAQQRLSQASGATMIGLGLCVAAAKRQAS
ncbi:MAG TPA: LysE family translocator [Dongiaceae bacterium]|nr:LysE family translocator [Dongiaceae bacterium]